MGRREYKLNSSISLVYRTSNKGSVNCERMDPFTEAKKRAKIGHTNRHSQSGLNPVWSTNLTLFACALL